MIQSAFTNAYTRQVGAQNQGIGTITQGAKDVGTLAMGITGFAGGLGEGAAAEAAKHTLAGRVGGIGGNIMLATIEEKRGTRQMAMGEAKTVSEVYHTSIGDIPADIDLGKRIKEELNK